MSRAPSGATKRAARAAAVLSLVGLAALAEERWWVDAGTAEPVELPAEIAASWEVQLGLEYAIDDEPVYLGVRRDLNRDGTADWILRSHSALCGTGGCTYLVIDGATGQPKGAKLFGFLIQETGTFIDGWPVLESCSRSGWSVLVYSVFAVQASGYARIAQVTSEIAQGEKHSLRCPGMR